MRHQTTFVLHNAGLNKHYLYLAGKRSPGFTGHCYLPPRLVV